MLELNVNSKTPASITAALQNVREMITSGSIKRTTPIHIVLNSGTYRERVKYNLSNPIIIEAAPGVTAKDCIIQADNCEAFHHGLEDRSIFYFGPNVTNVTLKNFSIINTHNKSITEGNTNPDAGETLSWTSPTGTLTAIKMTIEGRLNTLCLKGFSWFMNCRIIGDTDFIYGDVDTALFEDCEIFTKSDNRGDFPGYAIKGQTLANKNGFVFLNCNFTAEKRKKNDIFIYKTEGKGSPTSAKNWDSIVFLNCKMSELYNAELAWDDDMNLEIFPRGNAKTGIREYNSKVVSKTGKISDADTTRRNIKSYLLTDDDYFADYASRFLILRDTPFAADVQ